MKRTLIAVTIAGFSAFAPVGLSGMERASAASDIALTSSAAKIPASSEQGILFPYSYLDLALSGRVDKAGFVDYVALKGDKNLAAFLQAVAGADLSRFPVFTVPAPPAKPGRQQAEPTKNRDAELVFWINAYNALVLRTLAEAYPINSPDDIKGFDTAKVHTVAGEKWSLRDLRRKVASFDPRALFALSNGTVGGPPLAPRAYRYSAINSLLEGSISNFVNDPRNIELLRIQNKVTLNSYFEEFNEAFAPGSNPKKLQGVRYILSAYTDARGNRSYFTTNDFRIETKASDRTLNNKSSSPVTGG